jgi:hypothetical protein
MSRLISITPTASPPVSNTLVASVPISNIPAVSLGPVAFSPPYRITEEGEVRITEEGEPLVAE